MDVAVNLPFINCSLSCGRLEPYYFTASLMLWQNQHWKRMLLAAAWGATTSREMRPQVCTASPSLPLSTAALAVTRISLLGLPGAEGPARAHPGIPPAPRPLWPSGSLGWALGIFSGCHFWYSSTQLSSRNSSGASAFCTDGVTCGQIMLLLGKMKTAQT